MTSLFARFPSEAEASAAATELERRSGRSARVMLQEPADHALLDAASQHTPDLAVTDARRGFLTGLVGGAAVGAVLGAVMQAAVGFLPGFASAVGFSAVAGAAFGGALTFLVGVGLADRRAKQLAQDAGRGQVLIAVEVDDAHRDEAAATIQRHGGRLADDDAA